VSGQSPFHHSIRFHPSAGIGRAQGRRLVALTGLFAAALALSACDTGISNSTVQELVGYDKSTPDEFAVMPRAPLVMPSSLTDLPPPTPGIPRPQETQPREQAEAILFGQGQKVKRDTVGAPAATAGGQAILAKAGTADPGIRTTVDQETTQLAQDDSHFIDNLLFWHSTPLPGTIVDPYKESARLNTNAEAGQPLTTGETPIIIRRRQGLFQGIIN
jgi:hypothetical protein